MKHPGERHRRLAYMMPDENIVAVSASSVYRVLKRAGLLNKWNTVKSKKKEPDLFNRQNLTSPPRRSIRI